MWFAGRCRHLLSYGPNGGMQFGSQASNAACQGTDIGT